MVMTLFRADNTLVTAGEFSKTGVTITLAKAFFCFSIAVNTINLTPHNSAKLAALTLRLEAPLRCPARVNTAQTHQGCSEQLNMHLT